MSEYEAYEGKIKLIGPKTNEVLEDFLKEIAKENGYGGLEEDGRFLDMTYREFFLEYLSDDYVIVGQSVYKILSCDDFSYGYIFKANENKDETIDFVVRFYNGCMDFEEAIEEALNNMEKDNKNEQA